MIWGASTGSWPFATLRSLTLSISAAWDWVGKLPTLPCVGCRPASMASGSDHRPLARQVAGAG
jgi:hypothetical protein